MIYFSSKVLKVSSEGYIICARHTTYVMATFNKQLSEISSHIIPPHYSSEHLKRLKKPQQKGIPEQIFNHILFIYLHLYHWLKVTHNSAHYFSQGESAFYS